SPSGETGKTLGRTITLTAEDMQKKKNDVKARTTLLLSLPDEHQLRFSKYKTARELWATTKKTKKNLLKQRYGNFKAEGSETLEQAFNRLQVIVGQLQFMDVEIEKDDLNQKFLTSLAPEWLMHTIVWKNKSDLDTMSLDDLYNHLKASNTELLVRPSLNKKSYCLVITDDYSRFTWVFFLATKDETSPILKTFITGLENQLSLKVKNVRNKMHKAFPLPVIEFPLAEELPTANEESCHCQKKSKATAVKIALLSKVKKKLRITFNPHITSIFYTHQEMDQQYPTVTKIPILDTGKFEQWQFRIQQYLQHEHYALWEVIEFGDSYEVPESTTTTDTTSDETGTKSGRTVTLTAEDMEKKKNDVKARTTLLLSLPDEHQLRFIWRKRSDLDTMSLDNLYNHLKVYESEVQKKSEPNSQNMAFISSAKHSSGNEDGNTACVPTASTNVPTASASVATISQDTACAYIASQSSSSQIKFKNINQIDEDAMEEMDIKWNMALLSMRDDKFWKKTRKKISI
nr:ribonuclease H-like domain-containing protein [Tanacetum cinerariifolium]